MTDSFCTQMTEINEKIMMSVTEKLNKNFNRSIELMMQIYQSMMGSNDGTWVHSVMQKGLLQIIFGFEKKKDGYEM